MRNFRDVYSQNELECGPLWCNEGGFRIAKELQLLNPEGFGNIFLGFGGFHLESMLIACIGKFLEKRRFENVFVENEIFDPGVVKIVMNGGHYVRCKYGMTLTLMIEALHQLQVSNFLKSVIVLSSRASLKKLERLKNYSKLMNYTCEKFRKDGEKVQHTK